MGMKWDCCPRGSMVITDHHILRPTIVNGSRRRILKIRIWSKRVEQDSHRPRPRPLPEAVSIDTSVLGRPWSDADRPSLAPEVPTPANPHPTSVDPRLSSNWFAPFRRRQGKSQVQKTDVAPPSPRSGCRTSYPTPEVSNSDDPFLKPLKPLNPNWGFPIPAPAAATEARGVQKTSSHTKPSPFPLSISARSGPIGKILVKSVQFDIFWSKFGQIPANHRRTKVAPKAHHCPTLTHGINFAKIIARSNEFWKVHEKGLNWIVLKLELEIKFHWVTFWEIISNFREILLTLEVVLISFFFLHLKL